MKSLIRPAISMFVVMTLITGVAYPAIVTAIAQKAFTKQSEGSIVSDNGRPVGSSLIGQPFSDTSNFWGRPSATAPNPYNATASGGSNLAPSNPALVDAVKSRIEALRAGDARFPNAVPADLVTASASGLDPDISPTAAMDQIPRVAAARKIDPAILTQLINEHQQGRQFGFLGEPRINVLELNLALARLAKPSGPQ